MKQPESNLLRKELARNQQAAAHPDADLLAALVDGSLSPRERDSVYAHLALCARCRGILSIAADAAPVPASDA